MLSVRSVIDLIPHEISNPTLPLRSPFLLLDQTTAVIVIVLIDFGEVWEKHGCD